VRDAQKDRIHDEFALPLDWAVLEYRSTADRMLEMVKYPDYRSLETLGRQPGLLHLVAMANRPGAYLFIRQLELVYFPPRTPRNLEFAFRSVQWEGLRGGSPSGWR
jgi:hypothetical protein